MIRSMIVMAILMATTSDDDDDDDDDDEDDNDDEDAGWPQVEPLSSIPKSFCELNVVMATTKSTMTK